MEMVYRFKEYEIEFHKDLFFVNVFLIILKVF
jgi:hypothetical protein